MGYRKSSTGTAFLMIVVSPKSATKKQTTTMTVTKVFEEIFGRSRLK